MRSALVQRVVWRCLVLDEGHIIKNEATEVAQIVRKIHFVTALLLTGTPLQNNLTELWALLNFLYPQAFPEREAFDEARVRPASKHTHSNFIRDTWYLSLSLYI